MNRPATLPPAAGPCGPCVHRPAARALAALAFAFAAALAAGAARADPAAAGSSQVSQRSQLSQLSALVRRGDGAALARLQAAQAGFEGAGYAERLAYLQLLAQASRDAGQLEAAYTVDEQAARLAAAHGDTVNAAIGALGRVGHLLGSEPAQALEALGALDARYARVRDPQFIAGVQQLYGDIYVALGQFDFALGHYLKALEIARAHPGLPAPTPDGLRVSIARVYTYMHAPEKILMALPPAGRDGAGLPPRARARVFLYKGIADVFLGRFEEARAAYAQALAVARTHALVAIQADILSNIADSYLQEGRWLDAERTAREALPLARQAGDAQATQVATVNLGFALAGAGRLGAGLAAIDGVIAQMRRAGNLPDLADVLQEKSHALERAGRDKDALAVLREHAAIVARLASSEREKTVAVLQEQFNAQQRAIQIEGLRRENAVQDQELQRRRVWQIIASAGAALALLLCGFVFRLYRRSRRTQRRLEELNAELAFHSTHDALTGLLNRRSFREHMLLHEDRPGGDGAGACYVLLDIDHFKAINDRHGHGAGDEVLVEAARRLRETVGSRGLAMRWGGEEFLVYVDAIARSAHAALVRELLDALAARPVLLGDGQALQVTATAGALSLPAHGAGERGAAVDAGRGWQHAVALADRALYRGKQDGRNRAYLADAADPHRETLILPSNDA